MAMKVRGETPLQEMRRYVRFSERDAELLRAFLQLASTHFERISSEFYDRIREHEDAHAILHGEAQIERLRRSLERWLGRVIGGRSEAEAHAETSTIGEVHVRVGLPQRYVIGAMSLVRSALLRIADAELSGDLLVATREAISKALDVELAGMMEAYREDSMARVRKALDAEPHAADLSARACLDAMELAPLATIGVDADGRIRFANTEFERLSGYAAEEVMGEPIERFVRAGERGEATIAARSGKERAIEIEARAPGARSGLTVLMGRDVTNQRVERARSRHADRLAAMGTLSAGLAHEIKNPLNGARLHAKILSRVLDARRSPDDDAREALDVIDGEIDRIDALLTEFLDFARPAQLDRRDADIPALCARCVAASQSPSNVTIAMQLPTAEIVAPVDAPKLEVALAKLVENAIDAVANPGGRVVVRARREPANVVVEVEDDGPGVAPGAPIFDAFYSTKPRGTGLGLSLAHRIVTDHGGTLDVSSEPGRTVFRMTLPLEHDETKDLR